MIDITYDVYTDIYGGETVTETAFKRYSRIAQTVMDRLTFGRIQYDESETACIKVGRELVPLTDDEIEALQLAICAVMDAAHDVQEAEAQAKAGAENAGNVKSRSSGDESITYESKITAYDDALRSNAAAMRLYKNKAQMYINPHAFRFNPFYAGIC